MKDNLKAVLEMFADFDDAAIQEVLHCFKPQSVSKNTVLLNSGSICKTFYFVGSGCIRIYFIDKNGREKTRYVMLENHIGTALASFISQKPSIEFIEALDDSELLGISHADFYRLNDEIPGWKDFYRRMLEMAYTFQNKKIEQLVTLSARQRYDTVLKENPLLIQRVSNRVLASYLDIREETLSRLKSH